MRSNPFTFGNPISDPRRFIGRVREVEQIFGRLRNEEFESSSLVGEHRIGKTSLLKYLANPKIRSEHGLESARYSFVYVDLQLVEQTADADRLWRHLLPPMQRQCPDQQVKDTAAELLRRDRLDAFDLDELFQAMDDSGQHVVFLLDEFERITTNPNFGPDFYYGLRSLMIQHRVALVTSSRLELIELCHSDAVKSSPFAQLSSPTSGLRVFSFTRPNTSAWSSAPSPRAGHRVHERQRRTPSSRWQACTPTFSRWPATCCTGLTRWDSVRPTGSDFT